MLITSQGFPVLNGRRIVPQTGEAAHTAVLDLIQQHAKEQGQAVEATVLNRAEGYTTRIQVGPDGASRLVSQAAAELPATLPPPPTHAPLIGGVGGTQAERTEQVWDNGVARQGGAEHKSPDPEAQSPVPAELATAITLIGQTVAIGDLAEASRLASLLRTQVTQSHGPEHPYTLEALGLEAYVAHLLGDQRRSTAIHLHVAGIRHRQGDHRVREELSRAVTTWQLIEDTSQAVDLGEELDTMLTRLAAVGDADPDVAAMLDLVERHLHRITASAVNSGLA